MDTRITFVIFHALLVNYAYGGCDEKYTLKPGDVVEVTSPNYPSNYSKENYCYYEFSTEFNAGDVLHAQVIDVALTCDLNEDSLQIFDAFVSRPLYLGQVCVGGQDHFVSPKERLYMVFNARETNSVPSRGFKLIVESVPEFKNCYDQQAKVMTAVQEPQYLVSPYYPNEVAPDVFCQWLLKAPENYQVKIEIVHADMRGSNHCDNFGLYLYDGKTIYDDEKIASVCDNVTKMFTSSDNYLMAVFQAGHHVLNSGGGIQFAYYAIPKPKTTTDNSLLYILVGLLLGMATITVILIIIRFFILPARQKAKARRYNPTSSSHRLSSLGGSEVTMTSLPEDPPPPYHIASGVNGPNYNRTTNSNNTKSAGSLCGWITRCFKPSGRRPRRAQNYSSSGVILASHPVFSGLSGDSLDSVRDMMASGIPLEVIISSIQARELAMHRQIGAPTANDYQELPFVTNLRTISGRSDIPSDIDGYTHVDSLTSTVSGEIYRANVWHSVDSGYMDGDAETGDVDDDGGFLPGGTGRRVSQQQQCASLPSIFEEEDGTAHHAVDNVVDDDGGFDDGDEADDDVDDDVPTPRPVHKAGSRQNMSLPSIPVEQSGETTASRTTTTTTSATSSAVSTTSLSGSTLSVNSSNISRSTINLSGSTHSVNNNNNNNSIRQSTTSLSGSTQSLNNNSNNRPITTNLSGSTMSVHNINTTRQGTTSLSGSTLSIHSSNKNTTTNTTTTANNNSNKNSRGSTSNLSGSTLSISSNKSSTANATTTVNNNRESTTRRRTDSSGYEIPNSITEARADGGNADGARTTPNTTSNSNNSTSNNRSSSSNNSNQGRRRSNCNGQISSVGTPAAQATTTNNNNNNTSTTRTINNGSTTTTNNNGSATTTTTTTTTTDADGYEIPARAHVYHKPNYSLGDEEPVYHSLVFDETV